MAVITVENDSAWAAKHAESTDKTIVVDFSATWCGPCKMISPFFEELSLKYPNLVFLKVDVDACQGVAAECGIAAMPTFQARNVWKNGAKLEECVGANKTKLEEMIARYAA